MLSVTTKPQQQEQITFELVSESQRLVSPLSDKEIISLQYSRSSLHPSLEPREEPVKPKIKQYWAMEPQKLHLPKLGPFSKWHDHSDLHEEVQYCLKEIIEKGRHAVKEQTKRMNNYLRAQNKQKYTQPEVRDHKTSSLPGQNQFSSPKFPRKRSQTLMNHIVLGSIKENYDFLSSPRAKETKRKASPQIKNTEKQFNNVPCFKQYEDFKFAETINMAFIAKKLTLDINFVQQKKYLKKITQNRQNMQHPCTTGSILPII